jgi:hypothetical protein
MHNSNFQWSPVLVGYDAKLFRALLTGVGILVFTIGVACALSSAKVDAQQALTRDQAYERFLQRPVTEEDHLILERAREILSDENKWNRHDTRRCSPADTRQSLFCALQQACVEVVGEYQNRRVAIQEVRFAVFDVIPFSNSRKFHPLMEFNNSPTTTFEDIVKVLTVAESRLAARLK